MTEERPQRHHASLNPETFAPDRLADMTIDNAFVVVREQERLKDNSEKVDAIKTSSRYNLRSLFDLLDRYAIITDTNRSTVSKYASVHAAAIAQADSTMKLIHKWVDRIEDAAVESGDQDKLDQLKGLTAYRPVFIEVQYETVYLLEPRIKSAFVQMSKDCAIPEFLVTHIFMLKSLLTSENPKLRGLLGKTKVEVDNWDKWAMVRVKMLEGLK